MLTNKKLVIIIWFYHFASIWICLVTFELAQFNFIRAIFCFFPVSEDLSSQQPTESNPLPASDSLLLANERTSLGPGTLDAPTAGSTPLNLCHHDEQGTHDTGEFLSLTHGYNVSIKDRTIIRPNIDQTNE